jgi:CRISPR-associated protein Cas2
MTYFFSYDITDAHRRNEVSKSLEQFGLRVQKSVFQCDVPPAMAAQIKAALLGIINEKEDSLFFYPVCEACLRNARLLGNGSLLPVTGFEIL